MRNTYEVMKYTGAEMNSRGLWAASLVSTSVRVVIDDDTTPKSLCNELNKQGLLSTADMRKLQVSDLTKSIIEVKNKSGCPLCRLVHRLYI